MISTTSSAFKKSRTQNAFFTYNFFLLYFILSFIDGNKKGFFCLI